MTHTLKAESLSKSYKKRKVVNNVSLQVHSGQVVGLLGPNGAGKTTCFYMIVGLIASDKGDIYLDQRNITKEPMHTRARLGMGYLPQEPSVFRKLTVRENILAILETRHDLNKTGREQQCELLMEEFHIKHIQDTKGISLSGGERRRVEIARTLATDPHFILLDEPFAGVDPISVLDIKSIISQLQQRNIGILITDHNVRETLKICEHSYIMNAGEIIAEGPAENILSNQQVREVYLGHDFSL